MGKYRKWEAKVQITSDKKGEKKPQILKYIAMFVPKPKRWLHMED